MIGEFDIYGVLVPALLVWLAVAYVVYFAVRGVLSVAGVYRFIWHRPLFDAALYVILLGAIVFVAAKVLS
ncbi:DUF1656 domain-containing protein [Rhodoplanes sp. Z2-YC6860]|uniref:DUF1656 domain-containing protein n=1 Tax=Rhodoplanes sp. Z2-YC6860 TaxID=674703 RepID=UPI00078D2BA8|nr:DUF1656 domain-containing protein [Rhodoplanes sp. Z2-YC6860]AMN39879.1 hypothetical protein RHPLAN_14240 [Rhodoplanes sp. Z2-YC6860]